jgi:putative SOS response-associated peptidase YedK
MITKDADEFMAHLHNRMPVILERDFEDAWLDTEVRHVREVFNFLERRAGVTLDAYHVSQMVNTLSIEGERLI